MKPPLDPPARVSDYLRLRKAQMTAHRARNGKNCFEVDAAVAEALKRLDTRDLRWIAVNGARKS